MAFGGRNEVTQGDFISSSGLFFDPGAFDVTAAAGLGWNGANEY
jgi:hypothetical protein